MTTAAAEPEEPGDEGLYKEAANGNMLIEYPSSEFMHAVESLKIKTE